MNAANAMKNRSTQCLQTPMVKLRAMDRVGFPWISHIPATLQIPRPHDCSRWIVSCTHIE